MEDNDMTALQDDLRALDDWVANNKMGMNVSKCKIINFGSTGKSAGHAYSINGGLLESVASYKYLGVVFQKDLGWSEHVGMVSKKGISTLNFVMRQLKGTNQVIKDKAYLSLVRPIMEYASSTWDPYRLGEMKEIEKVQRLAARRVTGRMKRFKLTKDIKGTVEKVFEKPSEMVKELRWSTLANRRMHNRLSSMFRAIEGRGGWKELGDKIKKDNSKYSHRGSNGKRIVVKGSKKDIGKFSFINRTGTEWNKIDENVFNESGGNVLKFRKMLESKSDD
jgi:hypothetical protein